MNEPARNNSIHGWSVVWTLFAHLGQGLLYNKNLTVIGQTANSQKASVHLQFIFDNTHPGYPFNMQVDSQVTIPIIDTARTSWTWCTR